MTIFGGCPLPCRFAPGVDADRRVKTALRFIEARSLHHAFYLGSFAGGLDPDERRKAVNSFQIGLSHGIAGKLKSMKAERDAANKISSGRDLAPLKTSVIDDEMAKLELSFEARSRARRK